MQYVIHSKNGGIFLATKQLLEHKHCRMAPPDAVEAHEKHGVQRFIVHDNDGQIYYEPVPPAGVALADIVPADSAQVIAELQSKAADSVDVPDILLPPLLTVQPDAAGKMAPIPQGFQPEGDLSVPADFDINVQIRTLNKPQLLYIARQIKNLLVDDSMKVQDLRAYVGKALDIVKAGAPGAPEAPVVAKPELTLPPPPTTETVITEPAG